MAWLIAFTAVAIIPLLIIAGRRHELAVAREWNLLLTPKGEQAYRTMEESVHDELDVADVVFGRAGALRQAGSVEDALRILATGYDLIEQFSPTITRLLVSMAVFSRMVSAMAPVPRLQPAGFQLAKVAHLTRVGALLHLLVVTTAERFRLRGYILARGLRVALRYLLRSRERAELAPANEATWREIDAARHDVRALSDQALESFRLLLLSLAASRRV